MAPIKSMLQSCPKKDSCLHRPTFVLKPKVISEEKDFVTLFCLYLSIETKDKKERK
jgi:hypothetical protein